MSPKSASRKSPALQIRVRLIRFLIAHGLAIAARCVPRQRNLVVFSMARGRYWDNSKALFESIASNSDSPIEAYWLTDPGLKPEQIPEDLSERFVARNSWRGFWLCARSSAAIICYSFADFGPFREVVKSRKVLMLWHAITTKSCGLLDAKFSEKMKRKYVNGETRHYDAIISSSSLDQYYTASYTGVSVAQVHVTGLPRNDQLFLRGMSLPPRDALKRESGRTTKILYAPTFRDYELDGQSVFFRFLDHVQSLAEWATNQNITFLLRPHPSDLTSVAHVRDLIEQYPAVFEDCCVEHVPDVMNILPCIDGIVTDYSSIYVDGLALDLPVIFLPFDYELYQAKRGLAYEYDLITPGPKVSSCLHFQQACMEIRDGAPDWAMQRAVVKKLFFRHCDSSSSQRVEQVLLSLLDMNGN